jgi:hypothetical protein
MASATALKEPDGACQLVSGWKNANPPGTNALRLKSLM